MASVDVTKLTGDADKILRLTLPKFSKGYHYKDFLSVFMPFVRPEHITLGRLKYSNEWIMTVSSLDVRNKLLRKGIVSVQGKRCVISPYKDNTICGRIHWFSTAVDDSAIQDQLKHCGEIVDFGFEEILSGTDMVRTSIRFFILTLKPDGSKDQLPHFIKVGDCEGLVVVKGREPICFGCKNFGHYKAMCPVLVPEEKLLLMKRRKVDASMKWRKQQHMQALASGVKSRSQARTSRPSTQSSSSLDVDSDIAPSARAAAASTKSHKENLSGVVSEVNDLQKIVTKFGQKLVNVLNTVTGESPAGTSTANNKSKKKKKKKKKKANSENASEIQESEAAVGSSNPENESNKNLASCLKNVSLSSVESQTNESATEETGQTTKKKNKKKKKPAVIPELVAQ